MRAAWLVAIVFLGACRPATATTEPAPTYVAPDFAAISNRILDEHFAAHPERGVELGVHAHDGKLADVTAAGLEAERSRVNKAIAELEAIDVGVLSAMQRVERDTLLTALRTDRFELEVLRSPWRNPMFYLGKLDLTPYVSRDYAPIEQRAAAIVALAEATPAFLQHATENLEPELPRTWLDTALLQARGTATFIRFDVPAAMTGLPAAERAKLEAALSEMAKAVDAYAAHLEASKAKATDAFALGKDAFVQMIRETQGIEVDFEQLRTALHEDLRRNGEAMIATAAQIDPDRSVAKVVAEVNADKPALDRVLVTATEQSVQARQFLVDRGIVSIPTEDIVHVVETPPFMRWNAAFLNGAGPFETKPLPSFYYISPPDPSWPRTKQVDYVPGTTDLLFITVHEVWPGHFLHGLHVKVNPSRVLKSLWTYTTGEGWAHYAEEMMWNEGLSTDPRVRVGMLSNALLRNVRAVSAIGLHTEGWTVEQSREMFLAQAFQDEASAEQQAVRGTFDPMYLAYTVGKLAIVKLRKDVEAARGSSFSLRTFHDELLSYGAAPLSSIRRAMLGDSPML